MARDESGGRPDYCPDGIRHGGGATPTQALVRNVGTYRPGAKGDARAGSPRKGQSTDTGRRGGVTRSRGEGREKRPDRRGHVARPHPGGNR